MSLKQIVALFLSVALVVGYGSALAAEDVFVQEEPNVSAETQTAPKDTQTLTTAQTQNDIIIKKSSRNKTLTFATPITLDFTIKHPKGALAGRAVVIVGDERFTKKIPQSANSSFTFRAIIQDEEAAGEYPNYFAGTWDVKAYTEVKQNGKWVRDSTIKTTSLFIVPSVRVYPLEDWKDRQNGLTFQFSFYNLGDEEDASFPEEYVSINVYRKASGETKWKKLPFSVWTEHGLVNKLYNDIHVKNGEKYSYAVKTALGGNWSKRTSISYYFLCRPKQLAAQDKSKGTSVSLSWNRNSKASGYEVRYLTQKFAYYNEDKAKKRMISGNKNTTITLKNRTPGKQYWFKVRSYKEISGKKYYSDWSEVVQRYSEETTQ